MHVGEGDGKAATDAYAIGNNAPNFFVKLNGKEKFDFSASKVFITVKNSGTGSKTFSNYSNDTKNGATFKSDAAKPKSIMTVTIPLEKISELGGGVLTLTVKCGANESSAKAFDASCTRYLKISSDMSLKYLIPPPLKADNHLNDAWFAVHGAALGASSFQTLSDLWKADPDKVTIQFKHGADPVVPLKITNISADNNQGRKRFQVTQENGSPITDLTVDVGDTFIFSVTQASGVVTAEASADYAQINLDTRALTGWLGPASITKITLPKSVASVSFVQAIRDNIAEINASNAKELSSIAQGAFRNAAKLTKITLPEAQTGLRIENNAFNGCALLAAITLPETVESIGDGAFQNCPLLEKITVPKSVTNLGAQAFQGDAKLSEVTFETGSSVKAIKAGTFEKCPLLTKITIPKSVETLDVSAFTQLNVAINASTSNIEEVTFENPSNLKEIKPGTFVRCTKLAKIKTIELPPLLEKIGNRAFENSDLESINIPAAVKTIGASAFLNCKKLAAGTEVAIPASVESIGKDAFNGDKNLTKVTFATGSAIKKIESGTFVSTGLTEITVPKSVVTIDQNAFKGSTTITSVKFENDSALLKIDQNTFKGFTALTEIEIPEKVTAIQNAFGSAPLDGSKTITKVVFKDGCKFLKTIQSGTFKNFIAITELHVPKWITRVEANAFSGSSKLKKIIFDRDGTVTGSQNQITVNAGAFNGLGALEEISVDSTATQIQVGKNNPGIKDKIKVR